MARCEDYPCCGHTPGDPCPERNAKGDIVPRCCICDGRLKKNFRSSICESCQRRERNRDEDHDFGMNY